MAKIAYQAILLHSARSSITSIMINTIFEPSYLFRALLLAGMRPCSWLLLNSYGCGSGAENAPSLLLLRLAFVAPPNPAHPRRCLRSRCERRHLLPSAPKGLPFFKMATPVKLLPFSACKQAGAGRAVSAGYRQPMSFYDPRPPSLGNLHSSLRSWGLGWSLGDCSQNSQTPRLRPCSATLRNGRNQPAPTLFAPRSRFLAPVRPQRGLPIARFARKLL